MPHSPFELSPHARTAPVAVTTNVEALAVATCVTRVPNKAVTRPNTSETAPEEEEDEVEDLLEGAQPSCRFELLPHVHTCPR